MADAARTVSEEGRAFLDRHPELNESPFAASIGALTWGLMRALAECELCPGVFRVPVGRRLGLADDWDALACPACRNVWTVG